MSKSRLLPVAILSLLLPSALPSTLNAEVVNRVVLRVNDQIATLYDFEQRRDNMAREIAREEMDPAERRQVLVTCCDERDARLG